MGYKMARAMNTAGYTILRWTAILTTCLLTVPLLAQSVGIGTTTPDPTARLDIYDSIRGLLIPRLTTQQRNAIQNPAHTLMIFNIDSFCLEVYDTLTQQWYTISCPRLCQPPGCTPSISGPTFACTGDTTTYIATGCPNATYQWTVPPGWTILSGQGSDTLRVIPDTTNGTLAVKPCNQCGCGNASSLSVSADSCSAFCVAIGGANTDLGRSIIQTADGGYAITGYTNSFGIGGWDIYVVKLDAQGNLQWTKTIGGPNDEYGYSIIQTNDGGYAITGLTNSFGAGNFDVYVVKLDAQGNLQWTRTIGGASNDGGWDIIQTSDGGYAITGYNYLEAYVVKLDAQGNLQWTRTIGGAGVEVGRSIIQTSDGGYAIAGYTGSFGAGVYDVYVVKLTAQGNLQWTRTIGGTNNDYGISIIQTTDGGYAVAGYTQSFGAGNNDVYVVKLDASGNVQWTKTIGGTNLDEGYTVFQTTDGGYIIAGSTVSFGAGSGDIYVVKLDAQGNLQWTKTIGGTNSDRGASLTLTMDGGYAITGYTISYGVGGSDVYVVKLDAQGNLLNCPGGCQIGSGGTVNTGGSASSGGTTSAGGIAGSGGTISSGGTLINICP